MRPQRIQLSRKRGFNLQQFSRSVNGLLAVNCGRPNKWGNPFKVCDDRTVGKAIMMFDALISAKPEMRIDAMMDLRGRNLACWCKAENCCHCDVLLRVVNAPIKYWKDLELPRWMPAKVPDELYRFWKHHGGACAWIESFQYAYANHAPFGATVTVERKGWKSKYAKQVTGRWVPLWNNIAALVFRNGKHIITSTCNIVKIQK